MASQCGADSTKFLQWHSSVGLFQLSFSSGVPVYPASIRWVAQWYSSVHWVNQWNSSGIPVYTGPASVHWLRVRIVINTTVLCVSDIPWRCLPIYSYFFYVVIFTITPLGPIWTGLTGCPIQYYSQNWWNLLDRSHWCHIYCNSSRTHLVVDYVKIGRYGYCYIYCPYEGQYSSYLHNRHVTLEDRMCYNYCFHRSTLRFKLSGTYLHKKEIHTAHTIVSTSDLEQWQMGHTSDLIMIMR